MSKDTSNIHNTAARLLAVQAVYQMIRNDQAAADLVPEYLAHRVGMDMDGDGQKMATPNEPLFSEIVQGIEANREHLLGLIVANRSGDPEKAMEPLLKSVLLCGSFELVGKQATDFPIIISDYVDIAKAFFEGKEPGLVNGILDSIRKVTR